jgi:hypothetical protein
MDVVIVTQAADLPLLRHLLASYELYYGDKAGLVLFSSRTEQAALENLGLPRNARIVCREDIPELGPDDFRNQLYLKLIAHRYTRTQHFLLLDCDFLFVAPTRDADFFHNGKPAWFYQQWNDGGSRWKKGSEEFVGKTIPWLFMEAPQYVFDRAVAAELEKRYDLRRLLKIEMASEYVIYGWFAHEHFPDAYHWVNLDNPDPKPVVERVNQIPPTYCHLDPAARLEDFPSAKIVVFWSHWELAEKKMAEFLRDSRKKHFGVMTRFKRALGLAPP